HLASITSPPPRDEKSPPAAQQGEMKEFIQLTYSFCFLACLLDRGHIKVSCAFFIYFLYA
ncbi:MAG: hypothetical protein IJ457_03175, partial [Clostridia bacterium]|nr:hypothetical protein [Clostridia bacterium]